MPEEGVGKSKVKERKKLTSCEQKYLSLPSLVIIEGQVLLSSGQAHLRRLLAPLPPPWTPAGLAKEKM